MTSNAQQFTIGVEEEYQIVDPQTRALKPRSNQVLEDIENVGEGCAAHELFLAQIEIGTPICHTLEDVRRELRQLRRAVIEAAHEEDSAIAAASTHPFSHWRDQPVTPKERYRGLEEDYQQIAREHLICGCHVHIGIGDRERTIQVMNRARGWLAPLVALAGNSPFWLGEDTGYSSFRTEIWRRWPMAGSPHIFSSRAEYDALVRTLVDTGSISDETKIYWDMRPADRFQTLEFRATDVCLTLDEAVLVAGLVRALARTCCELAALDEERDAAFVPVRPELLRAAEWRAARYGIGGQLIDVHAGQAVPAHELIKKLLEFVRPALEEQDDWDEIHSLTHDVLERGNGAMRQCTAWQKNGELRDVVDLVVAETARGVI
jgi:carboxylate-amine ligase